MSGTTSEVPVGRLCKLAGIIVEQLPHLGLDPDDMLYWIGNREELAAALRQALMRTADHLTFTLTINYDQTVEEMVESGKYSFANSNITSQNFHIQQSGTHQVEVILVHFDQEMTSDQVKTKLDEMGLRPAELPELLALGTNHPDLQRQFPIIALGSVWQSPYGHLYCPYLYGYSDRRELRLFWLEYRWHAFSRFLALRKSHSKS